MKHKRIVKAKSDRFHGYLDHQIIFDTQRVVETKETKKIIIQERDVSYRFYLHQHPYVQPLIQRLLRTGIAGLQAADTAYTPDGVSLPGSIEIAVSGGVDLRVPSGTRMALLAPTQVTSGGVSVDLSANTAFHLAATRNVQTVAPDGMRATLVAGLPAAITEHDSFELPVDSEAIVFGDTVIALTSATGITLRDGRSAVVPSGTKLLLADGAEITIANRPTASLLRRKLLPELYADFFESAYQPNPALVQRPYPVKDLDFSASGAYSVYNWELFYHVPITIAIHLSKNQRFAEAQRWFHYVFDPTDDSDGPTPERFWKVRPFQSTDVEKIEEILINIATNRDPALRDETLRSIENWQEHPFRPHVIARYRQQAYMYKTVMAYLDNLIAWGDSLFRQDTGEAIDEAMMLYVFAANILGPRPQAVPKKGSVRRQTYANLKQDLNQFGIAMRDIEAHLPYDLMPFPAADAGDNDRLATLRSLGKALYFCVPRNDKLLSYWDTVADRLFKIRNSLNFQGAFRQLALFEPPIDPAMLARATAAGLDVSAIVNGLNQPLPLVRFQLLVQHATEIVQEVKSLGNQLLSAMEKEDSEALAILRAKHERVIMEMVEHVRYGQLQEAIKSKEGLWQAMGLAVQRYTYYERQLGRETEEIEKSLPELEAIDKDRLSKMTFAMDEPMLAPRNIEMDIAADLGTSGGKIVSSHERREFDQLDSAAHHRQEAAELDLIAKVLSLIPELGGQGQPMGVGVAIQFGGRALSMQLSLAAEATRMMADYYTHEAGRAAKIGSYARREQDWAFQSNLAAGEITQIFKQLRAAEIREAIAEQELKNHRQQMKHAEEITHFLNEEGSEKTGKKTNKALYTWMKREVKGLYSQCFQFAFDVARKAERALQHELGDSGLSYLQFGYLAGKEGLLAGEKLYLDIKRMQMAYHELNHREYELTKHVSLLQVAPLALVELRATGRCTVQLPEMLFDMDGPGHYFRRIVNVALSIPCVTGPYASVNCTLTLLKSSIRKTPLLRDGAYAREDAEDDRFTDYFGSLQSIVTSTAQSDSGLFETNLRDERYLPFENSGAISEWQLQLPANPSEDDPAQFDYDTISDVILHIRYTAREGGALLRSRALAHVKQRISGAEAAGSIRLFSVRHKFPSAWAKFKGIRIEGTTPVAALALDLQDKHYPFWSQGHLGRVTQATLYAKTRDNANVFEAVDADGQPDPAGQSPLAARLGNLRVGLLSFHPAAPTGGFTIYIDDNSMDDLWLALTWGA